MPDPDLRITRRIAGDPYVWTASYRALVAPGRVALTLRLQFRSGQEVTDADLACVQRETTKAVAQYYNRRFILEEVGGEQRPMHVGVAFVTSDPDLQVTVHAGSGRDNLQHWFVHSGVAARAHEVGHAFGFKDEYADPLVSNRATPDATGVYRDHSLMGDFHQEGALDAQLKLRHVTGIVRDLGASLGREFNAALAEDIPLSEKAFGPAPTSHAASTGKGAFDIQTLRDLAQRFETRPPGRDHSTRLRR